MNTLRVLASQVIRILTKGKTRDSDLKEKVVIVHLRQAVNETIKGTYEKDKSAGKNTVSEHYVASYELDVEEETASKRNYADISFSYINIGRHEGIQRVAPIEDDIPQEAMIPIEPMVMDLYGGGAIELIQTKWGYEPARGKLYFTKRFGNTLKDKGITKVEVKAVGLDPLTVSDTDPLGIPPEIESTIITRTLELLGLGRDVIKDLINDGNPNIK